MSASPEAGPQVDHGIARQRQIIVAFIATEELVRHGDNVAADPPLWGDPIVEAELEAVAWNAGNLIARLHPGTHPHECHLLP